MLRLFYFCLCNLMLILSTVQIVKLMNIKKINDKIICGGILYFFRILVYILLLGYVIKSLDYFSITIISLIELIIVNIIFKYKGQDIIKYIKEIVYNVLNMKYILKMNFKTLIFSIFIVTFIIISFYSIFYYEYSFDGNYYHLPGIIDYMQNKQICTTNNTLWNNVYPLNIELLNLFFILFSKSILLVRIPQIIFSLIGMTVVYSLMRELNFKKDTAFKSSMLYFVSPFILSQITTTYLDGILITLFLTLIYYLLKYIKYNNLNDEIMYFLVLSIFIGTKGTCLIYSVITTIVYVLYKLFNLYKKKEKLSKLILKWSIFFIIVIFIGCNWTLKNIIEFGNPIYPFKFISIQGIDAKIDIGEENEPLSIREKNYFEKIIISWIGLESGDVIPNETSLIQNLIKTYDSRIGGLGLGWTFVLLPCILVSIFLIIRKKYKLSIYEIMIISILTISFFMAPANWWGRYVGYIVMIGFIAYGIIEKIYENKKIKIIFDSLFLVIFILSIIFNTKFAINTYNVQYSKYDKDIFKYINSGLAKDIVVLEESYYNTQYFVYLKGKNFQNKVDTYYIEEMYPNPKVENHNIGTYENFCTIINSYKKLDCIIILDADKNRKNLSYLERYINENKNFIKEKFGEGIFVYEKIN